MTPTTVRARIDEDGILRLRLPLGVEAANQEVLVTMKALKPAMTQEEWKAWVEKTAGSISDVGFERHPEGEFEVRDPL